MTDTQAQASPLDTDPAAMAAYDGSPDLDLYSNATREMLSGHVMTRAQMDNLVHTHCDCPAPWLREQGGFAVVDHPGDAGGCAPSPCPLTHRRLGWRGHPSGRNPLRSRGKPKRARSGDRPSGAHASIDIDRRGSREPRSTGGRRARDIRYVKSVATAATAHPGPSQSQIKCVQPLAADRCSARALAGPLL